MFGVGGSEILLIIAVVALLFVPGVIVFGAGFLFGKKAAEKRAQDDAQAETQGNKAVETTDAVPTEHAETDGDPDV